MLTEMGVEDFTRQWLNMLPKEAWGNTVDIGNSQSKTVFAEYPQTVEVKEAMVIVSTTDVGKIEKSMLVDINDYWTFSVIMVPYLAIFEPYLAVYASIITDMVQ